jgi:hypothetical protein
MILVKCDCCKAPGWVDEYHLYACIECGASVCRDCSTDRDDESASCTCNACAQADHEAHRATEASLRFAL